MSLRRGFKSESNAYAREFRGELGLEPHSPLCPWKLAEHLGIPVHTLSSLMRNAPNEIQYLKTQGQGEFSAVTVFCGLRRAILHNDGHFRPRQAANIAHELSHAILGHPPTPPFNELGCRNFDKTIEEEANWLGPALLVSEEAALHVVAKKLSVPVAANRYGVSKRLMTMRINVTGARRRIR